MNDLNNDLTVFEQTVVEAITTGFNSIYYLIGIFIVVWFCWSAFVWTTDRFYFWPRERQEVENDG